MKQIVTAFAILLGTIGLFAQKAPEQVKTEFSQESLNQMIYDWDLNETTVGDIFKKHQGKIILLDIWASWCPDCITGLPGLRATQSAHEDVVYLFFSLDRVGKEEAWKNAVDKYEIKGEHYWFNTEWKNDFTQYIDLNWVPRYLLIDQNGKIAHYYSVHANDQEMLKALEALKK